MGRSAAYWANNRYANPREQPRPSAPYRDLPAPVSNRFRKLREALLGLEDVSEQVKYMGTSWGWAWEYGVGNRKLCWIHVLSDGISATFTVSDQEERKATALAKLSSLLVGAIREGQRTGPVRWCGLELTDQRSTEAFAGFLRRKLGWLASELPPAPTARRSLAG